MDVQAECISYHQTGFFSGLVIDYLNQAPALRPFYNHFPDDQGLEASIRERRKFGTDRDLLVSALKKQYGQVEQTRLVQQNLDLLSRPTTFTVTTAHQPNIFTGPLYFVYKILHAVRLAEHCKNKFPELDFIPVFFMGSEDADLEELGHIYLNGERLDWETRQTGAVGRMKVDRPFLKMIDRIGSEFGVYPFGEDITGLVRKFYSEGTTIQDATFGFVNALFGKYGLIVLIPDNPLLKTGTTDMFREELLNQVSAPIVANTAAELQKAGYRAQAYSREINLFHLKDDKRERIIREGDTWRINGTRESFPETEILQLLKEHPDRFSPNVILRGVFQEILLPNIAFIGGGGELAYWLELKGLFEHLKVPYPVLFLRNSFLVADKETVRKIKKLGFEIKDFFRPLLELQEVWIDRNSTKLTKVDEPLAEIEKIYNELNRIAGAVDPTLSGHVGALNADSTKKIRQLAKKMLRAEKRNYADAMRQISSVKEKLFPHHNLQERIENLIPAYARWGNQFIERIYENSFAIEHEFVVLMESD
jgi:bacillithiol biosynthesis cysteine-adding enzyme BshC